MKRFVIGRTALLCLVALTACGDGSTDAPPTATVDTLPNGAIRVHNQAVGAWDSAAAWRFVEETRIGALEGDGPDVFADVRDIEVDALGRVWVLDAQQKRIEIFDADGRHVRPVGRPGAGPGEIEDATGIEVDERGRVWLLDQGNARFSVFDTAGALLGTHRRESMIFTGSWYGGISDDGRLFDLGIAFEEGSEPRQVLLERDITGAVLDSIDLPTFEPELFELREEGRSMAAGVPFTPSLVWVVSPRATLWHGRTDEYRIVETTLAGDTLRVIEKDWTPVPVSAAERDSALGTEFIAQMRSAGAQVDPARVPDTKPAWTSMWEDDAGNLWVRPVSAGAPVADVFDANGIYLGAVALPPGFTPYQEPVVLGNRLYGVVQDELDVAYVVIGRLEGWDAAVGVGEGDE